LWYKLDTARLRQELGFAPPALCGRVALFERKRE
jgi:hypothetical protein